MEAERGGVPQEKKQGGVKDVLHKERGEERTELTVFGQVPPQDRLSRCPFLCFSEGHAKRRLLFGSCRQDQDQRTILVGFRTFRISGSGSDRVRKTKSTGSTPGPVGNTGLPARTEGRPRVLRQTTGSGT